LAQSYGLSLIATALKRGQFFLVAEILRFLIPPRESSSGLVQWGPAGPPTPLAAAAAAADAPGAAPTQQQQQLQKQPSADRTPAAAAGSGSSGWFGWLWGSSGSGSNAGQQQQQQQQQRHHPQGSGPGGSPKASAGSLSAASQYRQSLAGGPAHANGDWHGLTGSVSAAGAGAGAAADGGGGFAPGANACRVVAEKGWALLGQVRRSWVGQGGCSWCVMCSSLLDLEPSASVTDARCVSTLNIHAHRHRLTVYMCLSLPLVILGFICLQPVAGVAALT
jgi:hypothetical protein